MYNAWHKKLNKCQLIKTLLMNRCMYVIEPTEEGLQHGRICSVCQKLHHIQKERATVSTEGLLHQVSVWGRVRISLLFCLCCGPLLSPIKMEVLCWHIMIQWNLFTVKLLRTSDLIFVLHVQVVQKNDYDICKYNVLVMHQLIFFLTPSKWKSFDGIIMIMQ